MSFRYLSVGLTAGLFAVSVPKAEAKNPESHSKFVAAQSGQEISGQYVVVLKEDAVSDMALQKGLRSGFLPDRQISKQAVESMAVSMEGRYGLKVEKQFDSVRSLVAKMDRSQLEEMLDDDRVAFIEQDHMMELYDVQPNATWGLDRIDQASLPLNQTYEYGPTGQGVNVYVIDSGILSNHRDFGGRVTSGFTAINDGRGTGDCNGHGTHVAGTVGSATYGVAKDVNLVPVRVFSCGSTTPLSAIVSGIDYVVREGSAGSVANMSLGGSASSAIDNAVNRGISRGIVFVAAAGNSNSDACNDSPARVPNAITVASSTSRDQKAGTSSWGRCVDIFAPGDRITSTWSNGGTRTISGTSMASPHVAGVAAQYLQTNRSASPAQVTQAILNRAASGRISNTRGSPNLLLQAIGPTGSTPDPDPDPDPDPVPSCAGGAINFRNNTGAYSNSSPGSFEVSSDGCSIRLRGNEWRITGSEYTITPSTVVTFQFSASGSEGEIQGVGFDADTGASSDRIFQLRGTQSWGISNFQYTGGTQTFRIPVGQFYTGSGMGFVIANDQDSGPTNNVVTISNVVISN